MYLTQTEQGELIDESPQTGQQVTAVLGAGRVSVTG